MKLVKLQYPVENILSRRLMSTFAAMKYVEVIDIYHYNRLNFYILERIVFKEGVSDYSEIINDVFQPDSFQILEEKGTSILCLMKLKRDNGFWPKIISGDWVINPPIIIDEKLLKISIIVKESFEEVYKKWSKVVHNIEIIAIKDIRDIPDQLDLQTSSVLRNTLPFPNFPAKQKEIALYATRHGYFESPKKISAKEIAEYFNISISAVNEHLRKAEKTVMHYFFS